MSVSFTFSYLLWTCSQSPSNMVIFFSKRHLYHIYKHHAIHWMTVNPDNTWPHCLSGHVVYLQLLGVHFKVRMHTTFSIWQLWLSSHQEWNCSRSYLIQDVMNRITDCLQTGALDLSVFVSPGDHMFETFDMAVLLCLKSFSPYWVLLQK